MMNQTQLLNLQSLLEEAAANGSSVLAAKDIEGLQTAVGRIKYLADLKAFNSAVQSAMPSNSEDLSDAEIDEKFQQFYDAEWTITFAGHSITLDNEATVYEAVADMMQQLIEDHSL